MLGQSEGLAAEGAAAAAARPTKEQRKAAYDKSGGPQLRAFEAQSDAIAAGAAAAAAAVDLDSEGVPLETGATTVTDAKLGEYASDKGMMDDEWGKLVKVLGENASFIDQLEACIGKYSMQLEACTGHLDAVAAQKVQIDAEIETLKLEIQGRKDRIAELEAELEEAKNAVVIGTGGEGPMAARIAELTQELEDEKKKLAECEKKLQAGEANSGGLGAKLKNIAAELEKYKTLVREYAGKIKEETEGYATKNEALATMLESTGCNGDVGADMLRAAGGANLEGILDSLKAMLNIGSLGGASTDDLAADVAQRKARVAAGGRSKLKAATTAIGAANALQRGNPQEEAGGLPAGARVITKAGEGGTIKGGGASSPGSPV